jgi:hypothetical protein
MIVPVAVTFYEYAEQVRRTCYEAGFHVDADVSGDTLNKKIRNAELAQYNFIFGNTALNIIVYVFTYQLTCYLINSRGSRRTGYTISKCTQP